MRAASPILIFLLFVPLLGCPSSKPDSDGDGDGWESPDDCDDADASVYPDAPERCDRRDNDCDGSVDEQVLSLFWQDLDADGYGGDQASESGCVAPEGYVATVGDCDDADPLVHPGADEFCNGEDDNCDGTADEGYPTLWYTDADGDGFGDPSTEVETCESPKGLISDGTDCDDAASDRYPGAPELCDADDDNCDGRVDPGVISTFYLDADGDGYGDASYAEKTCDPAPDQVLDGTDCGPADPLIHPGAAERCNDDDDDCDGRVDEDFDLDGDGFPVVGCLDGMDCDDARADVNPDMEEVCADGLDNDCDGSDAICGLAGTSDLSTADVKLWCPDPSSDAGRLVEIGDMNGDGFGDILIAAYYANSNGGGYVIEGPVTATTDMASAGHQFIPASQAYNAGRSIGMADTNGDALDDMLFGSPHSSDGSAYLFLGPVTADISMLDADVHLRGPTNTEFGHGSYMGDLNGDGFADAAIGAYESRRVAGDVFVKFGPFSATEDLENNADAVLEGVAANDNTANSLRCGTDLNGDGMGDLLIPAAYASVGPRSSGTAYVVYGPPMGTTSLSAAAGIFVGEGTNDYAGLAEAMGDTNGDGLGDAIVGSANSTAASDAGATYIIFGPASGSASLGASDVIIRGAVAREGAGRSLASGDLDGDGFFDLLVGAPGDATMGSGAGATFFFQGPLTGTLATTDAQATLYGDSSGDLSGLGLAMGDVSGDGFSDVVIGSPSDTTGGSMAGSVYALFVQY